MKEEELNTFYPKSRQSWRSWLAKHHKTKQSIWVIFYKTSTKIASLSWSEAVDEALCYGWIDSTKKAIDEQSYMQYFSIRKPKSNWSRVNKEKIAKLIQRNLMQPAGYESINVAKENGSWIFLDDIEKMIIPADLKDALQKNKAALTFYEKQSKSVKKQILYWVKSAKREQTRNKRISDIIDSCSNGIRPNNIK